MYAVDHLQAPSPAAQTSAQLFIYAHLLGLANLKKARQDLLIAEPREAHDRTPRLDRLNHLPQSLTLSFAVMQDCFAQLLVAMLLLMPAS